MLRSVVGSVFVVNRPGAHNQLSMFCESSIRDTHRNSEELHNTPVSEFYIKPFFEPVWYN